MDEMGWMDEMGYTWMDGVGGWMDGMGGRICGWMDDGWMMGKMQWRKRT